MEMTKLENARTRGGYKHQWSSCGMVCTSVLSHLIDLIFWVSIEKDCASDIRNEDTALKDAAMTVQALKT